MKNFTKLFYAAHILCDFKHFLFHSVGVENKVAIIDLLCDGCGAVPYRHDYCLQVCPRSLGER